MGFEVPSEWDALYQPPGKRFPRSGYPKGGYDIGEVDTFFGTLTSSTVEEIREAKFRWRMYRSSYSAKAVDDYLDRWQRKPGVGRNPH